jgi:hypothetical protein
MRPQPACRAIFPRFVHIQPAIRYQMNMQASLHEVFPHNRLHRHSGFLIHVTGGFRLGCAHLSDDEDRARRYLRSEFVQSHGRTSGPRDTERTIASTAARSAALSPGQAATTSESSPKLSAKGAQGCASPAREA